MDSITTSGSTSMICGICGQSHNYSKCNIIKVYKHIPDTVIPTKARLTLPGTLTIKTMADGSYNVVANTSIEKGTQFGPLEAQKLLTLNPSVVFPIKLFNHNIEDFSEYYLDTSDENNCNWMIFIMPAQTYDEQNLICFQEKSKVFYITIKDIQAGEFLKVWYSSYYAKQMNTDILSLQNAEHTKAVITKPIDLNTLLKKQQKIMERDNWICKFCGKLENDVTLFATHILQHYKKRIKKQCEVCKQSFSTIKSLRKHSKLEHTKITTNLKKCKIKDKLVDRTKSKDNIVGGPLLNDLLIDSLDNTNLVLPTMELSQLEMTLTNPVENQNSLLESDSLSLNVDNLLTENVKELDHFNFEIDETQEQFVCDVCLKVFSKLAYLLQHLIKHTGKYTCPHCLKIFCRKENLNSHKCGDDKKPQFICSLCQRGFMLKKYLIRHMNAIHNKKYSCENCNKWYYSHKEYKEHNCSAIPDAEKPTFSCLTCNKKFFRNIYLNKHVKTHIHKDRQTFSKDLICEICAQQFNSRKGLQLHMKKHLERTFACEICSKKFYRKAVLHGHMATHKEPSIACTVCDGKFKTKQSLAVHMYQHTGIRNHKCKTCPQAFFQRSLLVKHYKTAHSKTCHVCKRHFETVELLLKHKSEHILKDIFVCPLCNKIVKLRSSLSRHLKQCHSDANVDVIMTNIKSRRANIEQDASLTNLSERKFDENLFNSNSQLHELNVGIPSELIGNEINTNLETTIPENDSFENILSNFENIIDTYSSNDVVSLALNCLENTEENSIEKRTLDFNDLEIDLNDNLDIHHNTNINNQEVCLSMPDLTDSDREITLGENAYILDNGTIIEPKDKGSVLVYILDKNT